jgi:hypothetical protein
MKEIARIKRTAQFHVEPRAVRIIISLDLIIALHNFISPPPQLPSIFIL